MLVLVDTNILIDAINKKRGRREFLAELARNRHTLACCSVCVAEVYSGMRPEEREITDELLWALEYLETSQDAARNAGLWRFQWARKGVTLALDDLMIAAVAIEHGAAIATDNRKHFPLKELNLLPIPEPS
jgi:predicted nucleic acid-binding protein